MGNPVMPAAPEVSCAKALPFETGSHVGTHVPTSGVWNHTQKFLKKDSLNDKIVHHLDFDAPTRQHAQPLRDDKELALSIFSEQKKEDSTQNLKNPEISQKCCGQNGICSHEDFRDKGPDGYPNGQSKLTRNASFKLQWCSKSKKDDQHEHDIVSFEKRNITTAERSSKQNFDDLKG
ncbi:hypothetical protein L2E82_40572 [Cichorium intybus]|uniref:Uncharacterized protein n=1 Tax=Cichorium intybus TaxID=13427 RepID=A0ACB9AN24_CICIN|nr:hypothetical protein L2E82_40572 [Cichorium intybus]